MAVKKGKKVTQLIQVCYDAQDFMTRDRELRVLLKASDEFKCNDLLLITMHEEKEEKIEGKTIKIMPVSKWILEED